MDSHLLLELWTHLFWPLIRITFFVSLGLVFVNIIEALKFTHHLARLAKPLIRAGNLSPITGASFAMAFVSGVSANTMLAEGLDQGKLTKKEMILSNLFNSLPRYFLHLPTVFFLTVPLIKGAAFFYVSITFSAALLQTILIVIVARILLPKPVIKEHSYHTSDRPKITFKQAVAKGLARLRKRMKKILLFLVPIYTLFFFLSRVGVFDQLEALFASAWFLSWLPPQSLGIVILHVTTEFSAGLAAAGALLANNALDTREVVLALLAGNILSSPIRALRHQFPYYMGIFPPRLAGQLIVVSQLVRATCVMVVGFCYFHLSG